MIGIYFLVFVGVVQGIVAEHDEKRDLELLTPKITGLIVRDDSVTVKWKTGYYLNSYSSDPVLGYIVKVWGRPELNVNKTKTLDDKKRDRNIIPTERPREIIVEGVHETEAIVKDIRYNVRYHIRVLAYTRNYQGLLSEGYDFKLVAPTPDFLFVSIGS